MYVSDLKNKYYEKRIGVLGSGPTLNKYKDQINDLCDIVIACNGSVNALDFKKHFIDYFVYIDGISYRRDWFKKSLLFKNSNSLFKKMFFNSNSIRLFADEMNFEIEEFMESKSLFIDVLNNSKLDIEKISRGIFYNNVCTVSGVASQIAYFMGAKTINLSSNFS
ncbi:MAG: hypothetical protein KC550_02810 [Nanoarchaeota archaeon]|nr:hypothetical protein [Nanoarchaeota archaeon]